jgi:hypothetical protein
MLENLDQWLHGVLPYHMNSLLALVHQHNNE